MDDDLDAAPLVPLPRLYERDIDVLLREELLFSHEVLDLFVRSLDIENAAVTSCVLSAVDSTGETDVLAELVTSGGTVSLLIENKIDAMFQPDQPARYRLRTTAAEQGRKGHRAFAVLISPKAYALSNTDRGHFHTVITYEQVADAMLLTGTPRSKDRAALLLQAVMQARKAYAAVPNEEVTAFYQRVYRIAHSEYPGLGMPMPGQKGSWSTWHIFKADLPARIAIDWKVTRGTMGLSFWDGAVKRPSNSTDLTALGETARWRQEKETIIIEANTVAPSAEKWTDMSDSNIRSALADAARMLEFFRKLA